MGLFRDVAHHFLAQRLDVLPSHGPLQQALGFRALRNSYQLCSFQSSYFCQHHGRAYLSRPCWNRPSFFDASFDLDPDWLSEPPSLSETSQANGRTCNAPLEAPTPRSPSPALNAFFQVRSMGKKSCFVLVSLMHGPSGTDARSRDCRHRASPGCRQKARAAGAAVSASEANLCDRFQRTRVHWRS